MELLQVATVAMVAALSATAAPKIQVYPANCDRVFAAVKRAAVPPHYNFAMFDSAEKKGIVSTGSGMTGKRNLDITLTGSGESCTMSVGGVFSGFAHNDKGDLFKRTAAELVAPAK